MRIWVLVGLLAVTACGRLERGEGNDSGFDGSSSVVGGNDEVLDSGLLDVVDGSVIDSQANDSEVEDTGTDAGTCTLEGCDCPWLALNCSFYTPAYPCGVSAACGQTYDVDPITCVRTVHTAITDSGACALHDDGVTWCCP